MKKLLLALTLLISTSSFADCGSLDKTFEEAHTYGVNRVNIAKVLDCHIDKLNKAQPPHDKTGEPILQFCNTRIGLKKDVLLSVEVIYNADFMTTKDYNKHQEELALIKATCKNN